MKIGREGKETLARLVEELEAGRLVQGILRFPSESDAWAIGSSDLEYLLSQYLGMEVILILLPLGEPMTWKICPTCGTAYEGAGCIQCAVVGDGIEERLPERSTP